MSLNIKDQETHDLVKVLAELKGTTLTAAVKLAVKQEIEREKASQDKAAAPKKKRSEILMEFARDFSKRVKDPVHSWEINDLLYDQNGLPK